MISKENSTNTFSHYLAWFTATCFVFFQLFLQMSSTMMSEAWAHDFNLDEVQLSNLSSIFFYSYIGMQLPAGILYDRFSTKLILFLSATILALSALMFAYVNSYSLALIARFLMGLGAGSGFVGLLRIIQDHFSKNKFAFMFGLAEAVGMVGIGLGLILLTKYLQNHSWRDAMTIFSILSAVSAVSIHCYIKDKQRLRSVDSIAIKPIIVDMKNIICNKQVLMCTGYAFFIVSLLNAFTSLWGEPFLKNVYHIDPHTTSWLLSMVFVGLAIGSPLNGWLVKQYGQHRKLLLIEAGFASIVTYIIICVPNVTVMEFYILFFLIGFLCSGYGICYGLVNEAVNSEIQATAVAIANMVIVSSAPILQIIIGATLKSNSFGIAASISENFRIALTILPISYFISFIFGLFIQSSREKPIQVFQEFFVENVNTPIPKENKV